MLLHQQRLARPLPIDLRNDDERIVGEILREPFRVLRLDREIELAFERSRELGGDFHRLVAPRFGHFRIHDAREMPEQAKIGFDVRADSRPTYLEHDRRAILQSGTMDLRNRGGTVRASIEIVEHVEG